MNSDMWLRRLEYHCVFFSQGRVCLRRVIVTSFSTMKRAKTATQQSPLEQRVAALEALVSHYMITTDHLTTRVKASEAEIESLQEQVNAQTQIMHSQKCAILALETDVYMWKQESSAVQAENAELKAAKRK